MTADTPDIVERLTKFIARVKSAPMTNWPLQVTYGFTTDGLPLSMEKASSALCADVEALLAALRAAQSPQARDEGGAVEGCKHEHRSGTTTTEPNGPVWWSCQDCGVCWCEQASVQAIAAPSPPTDAINEGGAVEEGKLVKFFRSPEGAQWGEEGDYEGWTPAETAIEVMRRFIKRAKEVGAVVARAEQIIAASPTDAINTAEGEAWPPPGTYTRETLPPMSEGAKRIEALVRAAETRIGSRTEILIDGAKFQHEGPLFAAHIIQLAKRDYDYRVHRATATGGFIYDSYQPPTREIDLSLGNSFCVIPPVAGLPGSHDAINTAEGEAWLAQRGGDLEYPIEPAGRPAESQDAEGEAGAAKVASPPQAPQEVAGWVAVPPDTFRPIDWQDVRLATGEGRLNLGQVLAGCNAELRRRQALAAALTPRELTDEKAERGARAQHEALRAKFNVNWAYRPPPWEAMTTDAQVELVEAFRAAYRAITEEPAR